MFGRVKNNGKTVSSNVDFYSGFVYEMIGLPQEIFTPLFAMARIVGWCAHRNEELNFEGKRIIRPAYKNVLDEVAYVRFASVYRQFKDINTFIDELEKLLVEKKQG